MLRNVLRKCEVCLEVGGGHFETLLWNKSLNSRPCKFPPTIAAMFSNDNSKINLQRISWEGVDRIHYLGISANVRPCAFVFLGVRLLSWHLL